MFIFFYLFFYKVYWFFLFIHTGSLCVPDTILLPVLGVWWIAVSPLSGPLSLCWRLMWKWHFPEALASDVSDVVPVRWLCARFGRATQDPGLTSVVCACKPSWRTTRFRWGRSAVVQCPGRGSLNPGWGVALPCSWVVEHSSGLAGTLNLREPSGMRLPDRSRACVRWEPGPELREQAATCLVVSFYTVAWWVVSRVFSFSPSKILSSKWWPTVRICSGFSSMESVKS